MQEAEARQPFVGGELDLSGEVVDVLDETSQHLPRARLGLGTHGIDDILSEVGVKPRRRRCCCHDCLSRGLEADILLIMV